MNYDILWPLIGIQYVMSQSFTFLWLKPLQMNFLDFFCFDSSESPAFAGQFHKIRRLGCCLKKSSLHSSVAVTKSSLHYTSFIVSSWFGTIPRENWGGHFWEFTSIDTVWVCVSAISTADMYSNSSDPHQQCHGSTKPFLLRRFNLFGLRKSCKVWLLWQKKHVQSFTMSLKPLQIPIYIYIFKILPTVFP